MRLIAIIIANLVLLSAPQAAVAEDPHGLNQPLFHEIVSRTLERPFKLHVRLPPGYRVGEGRYPVVYLLDGGHTFPMLAGYASYLEFGEEIPPVIIVGISYGTDDWQQGNLRGTDFTAPANSRDYFGGAPKFLEFLKSELLPFIEARYRAAPHRRVVFGQSLGGQFVLYMAQHAPELFFGGIASNPALHRNLDYFIQSAATDVSGNLRLFVSSGTKDDPVFRAPALAWMEFWTKETPASWRLHVTSLAGHSHFSAVPEAFRQGMAWVFAPAP